MKPERVLACGVLAAAAAYLIGTEGGRKTAVIFIKALRKPSVTKRMSGPHRSE